MENVMLDVVGAKEASEILGVELQRISRWRKAGRLPTPLVDLALSPVWTRGELVDIANGGDPLPEAFTAPMDPPPLLGTAEVAAMLDVDKSQVARWRNGKTARVEFPEPDAKIAAGPLWLYNTIEQFAQSRGKQILLTGSQLAAKLHLSPETVAEMEPSGRIKAGPLYRLDPVAAE